MTAFSALSVFIGAGFGALLRWILGSRFNPLFSTLPLGTLIANLLGGLLIGLAIVIFARYSNWAPEIRLFVITGFLGGLTTFSTFSAEVVNLLARGEYWWGFGAMTTHLIGSLAMTAFGIWLASSLLRGMN
ncbi:fluoride ion transporter CrcB [Chromatium weissei]|nr:fluoride ion transporter CrcB [Chromatium weissei]